ncbi:MAG: hypothetical protein ACLSVG_06555, partial [Clostridia bacterium]
MKKIITLMLIFVLALGCAAGCGDDEKEGGDAKALTFTDVTNTMKKMSEGASFEWGMELSVEPVFDDEYFTKEDFETTYGPLLEANGDGTYTLSFKIKGEAEQGNGKVDFLLKNTSVTDIVLKDGKMYFNGKAFFNWIKTVMQENLGSSVGSFLQWPYDNEYIDMDQISQLLPGIPGVSGFDPGSVFPGGAGGFGGENPMDMDLTEIRELISALQKSLPMDQLLAFLNKLETAAVTSNVLATDHEKIELKIDETNVKAFVVNISALFRTDLADLADALVASLKDTEGLPENFKTALSAFDKEDFQKQLDETFGEENAKKAAETAQEELGKGHFYFTIGATNTSCSFKIDIRTNGGDASESVSVSGLILEFKAENKKSLENAAPPKILTEEELQELFTLFGWGDDGSDPSGDIDDTDYGD